MQVLKRLMIALVALALLGGLLEIGLRTFLPSVIETGARVALRAPSSAKVEAELPGSLALNALRWRIADVVVTAEDVPLAGEVSADARLDIDALPLIPTLGSLHDGRVEFAIAADQIDGLARIVSGGLAERGEVRDGGLVLSGTLSDEQFELPASPEFAIPYEATTALGVDGGDIVASPGEVRLDAAGPVADFLHGRMSEPRTVCVADRLPKGVVLSGIELLPSGDAVLRAELSKWLFMNPAERQPGSCE